MRDWLAHERVVEFTRPTAAEVNIVTTDDGYLGSMSDADIARFRAHAKECQEQADRSVRATDKEAWLRMANEWLKLAQDAERRPH